MSGIRGRKYIDENGKEVLTGGLKTAATNKAKYGKEFYARIGKKGGQNGHTGGFASMTKEQVREAGAKGGRSSRRGMAKIYYCDSCNCMTHQWKGRCAKCKAERSELK